MTYPSARALAEVARFVPLDRLVVETDCPYLPPQGHRGQRNEPAYLAVTAARVAELRGEPLASLGPHHARQRPPPVRSGLTRAWPGATPASTFVRGWARRSTRWGNRDRPALAPPAPAG